MVPRNITFKHSKHPFPGHVSLNITYPHGRDHPYPSITIWRTLLFTVRTFWLFTSEISCIFSLGTSHSDISQMQLFNSTFTSCQNVATTCLCNFISVFWPPSTRIFAYPQTLYHASVFIVLFPPWESFSWLSFFLRIYFFLFERQTPQGDKKRSRDIPFAGWLPKWPQQSDLSWTKAKIQEPLQGLQLGNKGPRTWAIFFCFPRPLTGKGIRSGIAKTQAYVPMGCQCGMQSIKTLHFCAPTFPSLFYKWKL